jgi:hypothetical protein
MRLKISTDFSRVVRANYPYEADRGEEFRRQILPPCLLSAIFRSEKLEIDLNETSGLGSAFWTSRLAS